MGYSLFDVQPEGIPKLSRMASVMRSSLGIFLLALAARLIAIHLWIDSDHVHGDSGEYLALAHAHFPLHSPCNRATTSAKHTPRVRSKARLPNTVVHMPLLFGRISGDHQWPDRGDRRGPECARMQAVVGQEAPFDHGRQQMKLLADLEVTTTKPWSKHGAGARGYQ